ncbi:inner membrane-spanning protein YciB [Sphingomonas sp.]|uniref:inner membrane-spanning protein YciB n=1 Tax=Sphingomonas sp. TaxID=28214 RepID=UPI002EDB0D64
MAIDYGPLLVFFAVNLLAPGVPMMRLVASTTGFLPAIDQAGAIVIARVIVATTAFMIATIAAIVVSKVKTGAVSPMLLISGALVVVFGGLTIYFQNPNFIKMKPTIVYVSLSALLAFGLLTGRPLLEGLLGSAYPGLSAVGWRKVTRNWTLFFLGMAMLNEAVWRMTAPLPTDDLSFWAGFKLWGAIPLTLLFALANVPMLMRHGLQTGEVPEVPPAS